MMRHSRFGILVLVLLLGMVSLRCEATLVRKSKTHKPGQQKLGTAVISDLSGNVKNAGDHYNISGTNVWVRMYVQGSWRNTSHSCQVNLGSAVLADNYAVKVNPSSDVMPMWLDSDGNGNWQSVANPGYVKFDSTSQLASGTEADLSVSLLPATHAAFSATHPIPAVRLYNKAYVLSNWVIPWGSTLANYVHAKSETPMNHTASPIEAENESHDRATILANLESYTVFYMVTHGAHEGQTYIYDCRDNRDPDDVIKSSSIGARTGAKTTQPDYNLVHLDACYTAQEKDMAVGFGILNDDLSVHADRAFIGWVGLSGSTPANLNWTEEVWDCLAAGSTVEEAVDQANEHHWEAGTARIYGDLNTTLHGVYGGEVAPAP